MLLLREKFQNTRIILASGSPRRQFLLGELGVNFEIIGNGNDDETYPESLTKRQIPVYLAVKKSEAVFGSLEDNDLLITADTIVWCRKKVLGKPLDRDDAIRILAELSGRKHQVITGVCIRNKSRAITFHSLTKVFFHKLTADEIIYYIDNYKPFDKAGAYGIQEWIGFTGIKAIKGSYFNVMGLPVDKLYKTLMDF